MNYPSFAITLQLLLLLFEIKKFESLCEPTKPDCSNNILRCNEI